MSGARPLLIGPLKHDLPGESTMNNVVVKAGAKDVVGPA
jgi:hypothetical protein